MRILVPSELKIAVERRFPRLALLKLRGLATTGRQSLLTPRTTRYRMMEQRGIQ